MNPSQQRASGASEPGARSGARGETDVERLVIRAPNWLGDAIMALPAMAAVRAALPDTFMAVAAVSEIAPIFREPTSARANAVITVEDRSEPATLRPGRFDAILLLPYSFRSAWLARRAGIPERWGYVAGVRRPLLTRAVRRGRGRVHHAEYYKALVRGLGMPVEDALPRVRV